LPLSCRLLAALPLRLLDRADQEIFLLDVRHGRGNIVVLKYLAHERWSPGNGASSVDASIGFIGMRLTLLGRARSVCAKVRACTS